ncbi:hypothetical protein VTL71DRAFT_7206 [Oculimacula yallundae]|uniref:Uncharacterized protein n=1 Tax=Oculimacula yallundae TaxID=86028 RepID=A0ABR4BW14_9HELO
MQCNAILFQLSLGFGDLGLALGTKIAFTSHHLCSSFGARSVGCLSVLFCFYERPTTIEMREGTTNGLICSLLCFLLYVRERAGKVERPQ